MSFCGDIFICILVAVQKNKKSEKTGVTEKKIYRKRGK